MKAEEKVKRVDILEGDLVSINPSIDFIPNLSIACVGLHLPAKRVVEINGKEREVLALEHFLIFKNCNDRDIHVTPGELPEGQVLSCAPVAIKQARWQRDDILDWLRESQPMDCLALYNEIRAKTKYYFEFENEITYDIITLWAIGTYFYHLFIAFPYLFINGTKRTGKTKLLRFLQQICHNAFLSTSITTASLHRTIQNLRATLLIDEHEAFNTKKGLSERMQELRQALLGGHQMGSVALKVEGDKDKRVESYDTYSPKALANISGLDDVLEDRCIYILMLRALGNQKNTDINPVDPEWKKIRNALYRFYLENASGVSAVSDVSGVIPEGVSSRSRQLWMPLFTLAKFFQEMGMENLVCRVQEFAIKSSEVKDVEESETNEVILIKVLKEMVKGDGWYPVSEIKEQFQKSFDDETPWANSRVIGRMLGRIGLKQKRKMARSHDYFLTPDLIHNLVDRYGVAALETTPLTPETPQTALDGERFVCKKCGSWSRDRDWPENHQCSKEKKEDG